MSDQTLKTRKRRERKRPAKEDIHGTVMPEYRRQIEAIAAANRWTISHTVEYLVEMGFEYLKSINSPNRIPAHTHSADAQSSIGASA